MFISIVIAVYNEEKNVEELTKRIYLSMNRLKIKFEVIFVIDGNDRTYSILKDMQKKNHNLILMHSEDRVGFAKAFRKGFKNVNSKATHILTMDGDLNHQPNQISDFITKMNKSNADIIIGSRYINGGKIRNLDLWKTIISIFANRIIRVFWKLNIKDKTSGFRLYKKDVIDKILSLSNSNDFEFLFEILILAELFKFKIKEVPIIFNARTEGSSKFQLFKTAKGYLKLIFIYYIKKKGKKPFITQYVADKRVNLILNYLNKSNKNKIKILDIGCGDRYITDFIKREGYNIIGIDRYNSRNKKWILNDPDYEMDATNLDFKDDSFDIVLALEVIEHCDCIAEINRVLKPSGLFFCSTPTPFTDWIRQILVFLKLLEDQDFESHDNLINLKKVPMNLLKYKKMFFKTSQFGIFRKRL